MSLALKVYEHLPSSSRSLAASLRGYYLNWWRYDRHTESLVQEALERDTWTQGDWKTWQAERLSFVLDRAATLVPHYRRIWNEHRLAGEKSSWKGLESWPVLEKQTLRENSVDLVAADCSPRKMFHDHTSGTTGTSLDIWQTAATVKQWYALFEARCRRWYGLTRHDRWAILGGQLVVPHRQQRPPFWVWNAGLNQLYMSSYHLSPGLIRHYLDAIARYKIRYILGYTSAIHSLAQEVLRSKRRDIKLDVVITNAEPVYEHQREAITAAFDSPVRETYGMAEIAAAASECTAGRMHLWPDAGIVEIDEASKDEAGSGDLICTGMVNADMPLIRYRVGDRGRLSDEICECGKGLPLIDRIDGRSDDVLFTADGRRVGRLDPVFKDNLPIREAQIIQESLSEIRVKYVPADDFSDAALAKLASRIRERMGDVRVEFEEINAIPRTSRGKFRAVICKIDAEERARLGL